MRGTKIVFFLIFMIIASTQTFRHIYVKFIEDTASVLDKYKSGIDAEIEQSEDLDELDKLYGVKNEEIKAYENENPEYKDKEEYKTLTSDRSKIQYEIRDTEQLKKSQSKLKYFWIAGFCCVLFGCVSHFFTSKWISLGSLISGFSEMTIWTSPLWDISNTLAYSELLNSKLIFSFLTLIVLMGVWFLNEKYIDKTVK